MNKKIIVFLIMVGLISGLLVSGTVAVANATPPAAVDYEAYPPFLAASVPPLVMLVMGRNHKLYYEAYNDASDLDGDGTLDITYKPDDIDYYGYFDSFKYYVYDTTDKRFEPVGITADKKVPAGVNLYWSGDFLNYLTMSRMDAVRKVLYGGMRSTDTTTETVLERAYIPQDAHSWGKEFTSIAHDGYDIRDYTPLSLPVVGTRHLFASTSLADAAAATYAPLLRVLPNNTHRIWDWVAKERPVCDDSLETPAAAGSWQIVPASTTAGIRAMTQTTYARTGTHPTSHAEFSTLVTDTLAVPANLYGTGSASTINGSGNPYGSDENYLTIFEGTLTVPADGDYTFSVDGDDAVEMLLPGPDETFNTADDIEVAGYYGGHGVCSCNTYSGTVALTAGEHKFQFRHEEVTGGDSYYLRWELNSAASEITDLVVRVKVADSAVGLETNCKQYPNGNYKPIGLLQRHGESNSMYFGLLSGSYTKNTSGGVLRKKVGTITDEIVANTGQFTALNGIIKTINQFRIVDFNYGDHTYNSNCGWITTRPISEGECRMWGNPVGEMMYETLRYFAGEGSPTADFTYSDANDNAAGLDLTLPKPGWNNPYDTSDGGFEYCAKPFMLVLSDINPTFDSDQLPGAYSGFGSKPAETIGNAGTSLDVEEISDTIFSNEMTDGNRFIGQQANNFDGACTEKYVDSFGNIRGLCPEEPTKQGSYYSAAVANYGWKEDMNTVDGKQAVRTYAVGLASPLPRIEIPLNGKTITLVPFAKSVGGSSISSAEGSFQPTNTIVDFFIEELHPYYGRFRINYEDVEQGADHDMDAIVLYEYQLVDSSDNPVDASNIGDAVALNITLTSEYAAGGIDQHMGYIISGTKNDGIYLEVKDVGGANVNYFLDTPNIATDLPFITTRRFEADPDGGSLTAGLLTNPLWYAAKWGGFDDENNNGIPDLTDEWDKDGDGNPDTYFYVVNPLKLEEQLNKSFADILEKAASGTAASVLATNSEGEGHLLQAYFKPRVTTASGNELTWQGYLQSLWVDPLGNLREDSNPNHRLDLTNTTDSVSAGANVDKIIAYTTDVNGDTKLIRYTTHYLYHPKNGLTSDCRLAYVGETCPDLTNSDNYELVAINAITPIFEAGDKLRQRTADTRKIFTFIDGDGVDEDGDGLIDQSGEDEGGAVKIVGQVLSPTTDLPFDNIDELIAFHEDNLAKLKPFLGLSDSTAWDYLDPSSGPDHNTRVKNLINYIRGKDSADLVGNPGTRTRTTDEGTVWKLGDIVNSTPVSISKAPDYYHLIYGDESFQTYLNFTKDRETVVYVGANDGTLHAFTSWYYNASGQYTQPAATTEGLGDELWAYIPQTLLPHLKFLAAPDYAHSFYVDLKPKLFDARIFNADATHPGGWGTILLVGLNMGGKHIWAEGDFDGDAATLETRHFYPTYICMDVTNPRVPRLLWERSYENLAMSTSFPAAVAVGAKRTVSGGKYVWDDSKWSVAFGSGPTEYDGTSNQSGYMFVVDLKTGKPFGYNDGTVTHDWLFTTGTANTSMNSPTAFDKNLTYNVDSIYFGSIADAGTTPPSLEGKVYKINTHTVGVDTADPTFGVPSETPTDWTMWPMADSPGPITAPIALSTDKKNNVWAFFGTGRYQSNADKMDENQQYFFGVKDPYFNKDHVTSPDDYYYNTAKALEVDWSTDLFDATGYSVHTNRTVTGGVAGVTDWSTLLTEARKYDGWYHELEAVAGNPSERVISKATILGGIVFFPGYTPNDDICGFGGDTNFYANYYETGTAYYKHILPGTITTVTQGSETTELVNSKYFVGHGAPPPAAGFHVGREKGATAFLQMSTGEVVKINVETAFPIKSGIAAWRDKNN